MFDIIVLVIFVSSAACAVAMVWRKIPLLAQVPHRLIHESFVTRPSRIKQHLDPLIAFFRGGKYREVYYYLLVEILSGLRLWLLRMERLVFRMLESVQMQSQRWSTGSQKYWSELKQWKQEKRENGETLPETVLNPEAPPPAEGRNSFQNGK